MDKPNTVAPARDFRGPRVSAATVLEVAAAARAAAMAAEDEARQMVGQLVDTAAAKEDERTGPWLSPAAAASPVVGEEQVKQAPAPKPVTETLPAPAPAPPPAPAAPQGVEGSSGTGAAARRGGSGGGSGSGGVHEREEQAVPVAEADSDDDGAAVVTPGQGTDPEQPVPASGERGTVKVGAKEEGCTVPATGGGCFWSSGGGGGGGGGESGTAKDAAISVSAAGARGLNMASLSDLELLATVCVRAQNESYGGIDSGGGGDGANDDA
eukprot:g8237.t1